LSTAIDLLGGDGLTFEIPDGKAMSISI